MTIYGLIGKDCGPRYKHGAVVRNPLSISPSIYTLTYYFMKYKADHCICNMI